MKISILTPSLNNSLYIHDCLESVKNQTNVEVEHILIDGKSTDHTLKIANSFPHLNKIISEADNGIYDAINKGLKLASGQIIGILNSDDYYLHNLVLNNVLETFERLNVDAVYGDLNYVNRYHKEKIVRRWKAGKYDRNLFLRGWMPPHPAFFIRKSCYSKYGIFNTNFSISADYELMLRMLYKHEISCAYLPEVLVNMRTGGKSNLSWKARWQANQEDRMAWKVNGLKPGLFTLWMKPLSKLGQFFGR